MSLRTLVIAAALASPLMAALPAHDAQARTSIDINIGTPPPPPRVVAVPPPRAGYVWAPGYWRWDGHRHVWADGRWMRERHGYHYVDPRWDNHPGGYRFNRGHWERG